jgi:exodeoxyribonuclease VII large subunit
MSLPAAPLIDDPLLQAGDNAAEFTVSELSLALKRTLEDTYGYVRVRGEISGFKRAASGHVYFALKDADACLDSVCWRGTAQRLGFKPEDGLEVVATGRITTYPGRSKYQLVVERLAPAGLGALMALLEERKRKLAAEGLFALERKRPLPFLPAVIGVVTSPTGAVIRDILHRVAERCPRRVLLWPVLVQGEQAAAQVAAAIEGFNRLAPDGPVPRPDVLIVARGGGSLEDLWAFNEEVVVRAAAASAIPLIAAVGHETDTTLIDLAADQRAPTPTAAAELAVPVRAELLQRLGQLDGRGQIALQRGLRERTQHLAGLARGLPDPGGLLGQAAQRLDELAERLPHGLAGRVERARLRLAEIGARLGRPDALLRDSRLRLRGPAGQLQQLFAAFLRERQSAFRQLAGRLSLDELAARLPRQRSALAGLGTRQDHAIGRALASRRERLDSLGGLLASLSYQGVLARGFALVRDDAGRLVTSARSAAAATALELEFADGGVRTLVAGRAGKRIGGPVRPAPDAGQADPSAAGPADRQGRLL